MPTLARSDPQIEKGPMILRVVKDRLMSPSAVYDVVLGSGKFYAQEVRDTVTGNPPHNMSIAPFFSKTLEFLQDPLGFADVKSTGCQLSICPGGEERKSH